MARGGGWGLSVLGILLGILAIAPTATLLGAGGVKLTAYGYVLYGLIAALLWLGAISSYRAGQRRLGGKPPSEPKLLTLRRPRRSKP